jgi:hypothetical protein
MKHIWSAFFFPSIRDEQELPGLSSAFCRVVMFCGSVFYALQSSTSFSLLAIEQMSIITQLIWYSHGRAYQKRKLCAMYFVQLVCLGMLSQVCTVTTESVRLQEDDRLCVMEKLHEDILLHHQHQVTPWNIVL